MTSKSKTNKPQINNVWLQASALAGSQANLAKLLEISESQINRYIRGKFLPPPKAALKMERILGIHRHNVRPDLFPPPVDGPKFLKDSTLAEEAALVPLFRAIKALYLRGLGPVRLDDVWVTLLVNEVEALTKEVERLRKEAHGKK